MAKLNPTGWADDRLQDAYNLIEAVQGEWNQELDVYGILKDILDKIEDADCELERMP